MKYAYLATCLILMISCVSATQIYIATGNDAAIPENKPGGTCWAFPDSGLGNWYDKPYVAISNMSYCVIPGKDTANMKPGRYTIIYQEPAFVNGRYFTDVSLRDDHLLSSLDNQKLIISGKQAYMVMDELKALVLKNGLNTIKEDVVVIQEPFVKLSDFGQVDDNLFRIRGTSNYANGTEVIIKVDEQRYFAQHNDTFTYKTLVIRPYDEISGVWQLDMQMPIQEMVSGWHEITIYAGTLVTTGRFKIDEQKWTPGPTPTQFVKYLSDGNIAPQIVIVNHTEIVDHYINTTIQLTATPTPPVTDALGEKIDYPYKYGDQITGWGAIAALLAIACIVLARDYKWK